MKTGTSWADVCQQLYSEKQKQNPNSATYKLYNHEYVI